MNILVINESSTRAPRKFIQKWCLKIQKQLVSRKLLPPDKRNLELTLVFLNRGAAKKLNKDFRGKNYATDVLSFLSMDEESLGELVVCPHVLRAQAKEHGLTYKLELGYMILHGLLHLLGYDHEKNKAEADEMFQIQDEIFAEIQ